MKNLGRQISEPEINYNVVDNKNVLLLIDAVKKGLDFDTFASIANKSPFNMVEWCQYLHLSERTLQRYKKEGKSFDPIYSEKIFELTMLCKYGAEVFENKDNFQSWLEAAKLALGGIKPKGYKFRDQYGKG